MDRDSTSVLLAVDVETAPSTDSFEFVFDTPQPTEADVPENGRLKDPIKIEEWKKEKLISMFFSIFNENKTTNVCLFG